MAGGERDPQDAARGTLAGTGDRADETVDLLRAGGPEELGDDLLLGAARSRRLAREGRTGEDRVDGQAEPLEAVLLKACCVGDPGGAGEERPSEEEVR